jgi:hypothetical protein
VCVPFQVNATPSVKPKIKTAVDDQKFLQTRHNFKHGSFVISTSFHEWEKIKKFKEEEETLHEWLMNSEK